MTKPTYPEVMLDLETMGTGPDAAIVAIGAVAFDIDTALISPRSFYVRVNLRYAVGAGGVMDAETVIWWLQQSAEARQEITREDLEQRPLVNALLNFRNWLKAEANGADSRVWGNGAALDNVILRRAYQRLPMDAPWSHWNDRCYRTIKGLYGSDIKIERRGTHHHALADAEAQAVHLLRMLDCDNGQRPYGAFFASNGDAAEQKVNP
jgi:exodeoxyribonuclease VIII